MAKRKKQSKAQKRKATAARGKARKASKATKRTVAKPKPAPMKKAARKAVRQPAPVVETVAVEVIEQPVGVTEDDETPE
jgi:hypothetical protein